MNTSRKLLIAGATALAAATIASTASAQNSATTNGTASVTVIRPITIGAKPSGKGTEVKFGTVVQSAATITIDPSTGNRTSDVSTALVGGSTGGSNAEFEVSGEGGQAISISVPASTSISGPSSSSLTVNLTTTSLPTTLSGALGDATPGTADFGVGGNVTIATNTTNGAYTGTFTITASYN